MQLHLIAAGTHACIQAGNNAPCCRVRLGVTSALLPVINYALTKFSRHVAQALISAGFEVCGCFLAAAAKCKCCPTLPESDCAANCRAKSMLCVQEQLLPYSQMSLSLLQLQSKTDARFVECAFKALRDIFGVRPVLTVSQFLEQARLPASSSCKSIPAFWQCCIPLVLHQRGQRHRRVG